MKKFIFLVITVLLVALSFSLTVPAFAEEAPTASAAVETTGEDVAAEDNTTGTKAIAAGMVIALVAAAGAVAMAITIAKSVSSMARQPEASGKINSAMMLGLVFIETAIIYGLIVSILIIFVL